VRTITVALTLLIVCGMSAWAQEGGPTLYYFEARGQNLLAADPGSGADPAFLIFPDGGDFSEELCQELGVLLAPGDGAARGEMIKAFQGTLSEQFGVSARISGSFSTNTAQQIRAASEKLAIANQVGPVRLINLNKALAHPTGNEALRAFLKLTTLADSGAKEFSVEQLNRCRPVMERNLNVFTEQGQSRLLRGRVRGLFALAECSEDRSDADSDGLFDVDEVNLYGSDPKAVDTDADGIPDAEEVRWQGAGLKLDPTQVDSDGDGLSDKEEMDLRTANTMVDPGMADTDGDGLSDKEELTLTLDGQQFDPTDPNSIEANRNDGEVYQEYLARGDQCNVGKVFLYLAVVAVLVLVGFTVWQRRKPRKLAQQYNLPKQVIQEVSIPKPAETKGPDEPAPSAAREEEEFVDEEEDEADEHAAFVEDEIVIEHEEEERAAEEIVGLADVDYDADLQSVANRLARVEAIVAQRIPPAAYSAMPDLSEIHSRLDEMGRLLAQTCAASEVVSIRDRLRLMEESVSELAQKIDKLEQLNVRSMSEWGRQLSDMEERINRLIREKS